MNRPGPATTLIIGGTAAYHIRPADHAPVHEERVIDTPFGPSSRLWRLAAPAGHHVWYASRHGDAALARSARFVNHRANLWAAHLLGVKRVLSWNSVGAINERLRVGDMRVPDGLLDWTRNRVQTFGPNQPPAQPALAAPARQAARTIDHINDGRDPRQAAHPFAPAARAAIQACLGAVGPGLDTLTYVCTEGPRLETAAEIDLAARLGADMVGMTLCPEVWLALELGLAYASLAIVTNFATGRWHIDPRRDFGATVAARALALLLTVA